MSCFLKSSLVWVHFKRCWWIIWHPGVAQTGYFMGCTDLSMVLNLLAPWTEARGHSTTFSVFVFIMQHMCKTTDCDMCLRSLDKFANIFCSWSTEDKYPRKLFLPTQYSNNMFIFSTCLYNFKFVETILWISRVVKFIYLFILPDVDIYKDISELTGFNYEESVCMFWWSPDFLFYFITLQVVTGCQ